MRNRSRVLMCLVADLSGVSVSERYARSVVVARSRIELPTFHFSGLGITVQDGPQRFLRLLSDLRYTLIDAGARGCMRLGMRLRN